MNNQTTLAQPVKGVIRAKLNEGFGLRLPNNETCFVPIGQLAGYSGDERFQRYDALNIGDVMEVIVGTASRRPIASEIKALEYNAEIGVVRGAVVEFFVVSSSELGVAVRLLAPACAKGVSAFIHSSRLSAENFELLARDSNQCAEERVGHVATVASIRRNEKKRLSIKLTVK
ncbi:MAG: hypothetical protein QG574_149 [Cyanobacteriota bacterium erpe_2018_sw_21hr_WHONDRS-SW48-000092_B_bin.40]|nr:hypothetical protein [Cyanobacteriota bacterium erpe_2018_sw_21hr_WHONDRS-SW48-000092_B_bin.40]